MTQSDDRRSWPARQHARADSAADAPAVAISPTDHGGKRKAQQHRDLVAPERERRRHDAQSPAARQASGARAPAAAAAAPAETVRRLRIDAGVLQPARGSAAEHEHHGRQHAGRPPARRAASRSLRPQAHRSARCANTMRSNARSDGAAIEQRPQDEQRREDQRLRIGNARMPAIVIRIPERRGASVDRMKPGSGRRRRTGSWSPTERRCR